MSDTGAADDEKRTRIPPSDVFSILGNETRMDIVRALAEAPWEEYRHHDGFSANLTFSELREQVGLDDSGQFNYHLDKLVGRFVVETEGGYALNYLGVLLYRTVVAGFFDTGVEHGPFETPSDCRDCGAALEASYRNGVFTVACPSCGREYMGAQFPPSAIRQWEGAALLDAFDQYLRHHLMLVAEDTCVWCGGHMPGRVEVKTKSKLTGENDAAVFVDNACESCNGRMFTLPGETVLYHPAVVSFFYEHDVDVTDEWLWDLRFVVSFDAATVRTEEPLTVALTVTCEDDELTLVLDERADVIAVEE